MKLKNNSQNRREFHVLDFLFWHFFSIFWMVGIAIVSKGFYVVPLLLGLLYVGIFMYYMALLYSIKRWKKTTGKCNRYYIENFEVQNSGRNINTWYRPYCSYKYIVNEKYSNDQLSLSDSDYASRTEREAMDLINQEKITVYYNPKNPMESVLLRKFSSKRMTIIWGLLFFGITLLLRVFLYLL